MPVFSVSARAVTDGFSFAPSNGGKMQKSNTNQKLRSVVGIALFAALAFGVSLVFRFPVLFLTFDAKDAIITIAAFVWGPLSAIPMAVIAALLELVTISDTGLYGLIMNIASTLSFALTAATIYKFKRTRNGSIIAIYSAVVAVCAVMMLMNVLITPYFMGQPTKAVIEMLPTVLLPFNFAKAMLNSAVVVLLYKPCVTALRLLGFAKGTANGADLKLNKNSAIMLIIGAVSLIFAVTIFIVLKLK